MISNELIQSKTEQLYPSIVNAYKHLHQHPELSFREEKTAAFVRKFLDEEQIPYRANIGGHGILAKIEGRHPTKKIIALRADMDALPIEEENAVPYKSVNAGVMHACGHDSHTASLMGVAKILNELKSEFSGTVLLIFQPGEEKDPGGARLMLQDGVFDECEPELIIAQHAFMDMPTGVIGFCPGTVMASADEVHLVIRGKGGHAAMPHLLNDTVLAASQIVVSMQQVVSRCSNPFKPMVLSFGKLIANGATNVIPDEVFLSGTLRAMDEDERKKVKEVIYTVADSTAKAYGCTCDIDIRDGYPTVINNEQITAQAENFAKAFLGESRVIRYPVRMTSEDFGFFSQKYPSTFYRFGVRGETNQTNGVLHTSTFLIEEEALKTAVGGMVAIALGLLSIKN